MKNLGRILRPQRFLLAGLLLFVSLLGLGITQPGEFSAAATSQPAGLTSPSNTHVVAGHHQQRAHVRRAHSRHTLHAFHFPRRAG